MSEVGWQQLDVSRFLVGTGGLTLLMDTVLHPLDVIKVRQQFNTRAHVSMTAVVRRVWAKEGWRGFFRGFVPSTLGSFPGTVVYYASYEIVKDACTRAAAVRGGEPSPGVKVASSLVAGCAADVVSSVAHTPAEVISQRLMVDPLRSFFRRGPPMSMRGAVREVVHVEGLRGLFRGFWASVYTYAPSSAVWFGSYEGSLILLRSIWPDSQYANLEELTCGAVAGAAGAIVTNPLDVAKTRLQTLDAANEAHNKIIRKGYWHVFWNVCKTEGVRGMCRGLPPRLFVAVPGSAVTFAVYEIAKRLSCQEAPS
eukprot:m.139095 g.139095  ORF g.139095 m.139095 type:complete len:310 (-) comp17050_c0_seq1:226-1155(-)